MEVTPTLGMGWRGKGRGHLPAGAEQCHLDTTCMPISRHVRGLGLAPHDNLGTVPVMAEMMPRSIGAGLRRLVLASEESSRKLCRVAPTPAFRRNGLFLSRTCVWLHHLAIQVPGRMSEHRHHNHKSDEQRQRANQQEAGDD